MYWIINLNTKQYIVVDGSLFFEGDWKLNTPWPDSDYIDLMAIQIYTDQIFQPNMVYAYDLCRNGMLVGVYYDSTKYERRDVTPHVRKLKSKQDVANVHYYALAPVNSEVTRYENMAA